MSDSILPDSDDLSASLNNPVPLDKYPEAEPVPVLKKPEKKGFAVEKTGFDKKNAFVSALKQAKINVSVEGRLLIWADYQATDDANGVLSSQQIAAEAIRLVEKHDFSYSLTNIVKSGALLANVFIFKSFDLNRSSWIEKFVCLSKQMGFFEDQLVSYLKKNYGKLISASFNSQQNFASEEQLIKAVAFELVARAYQGGFFCDKKRFVITSEILPGVKIKSIDIKRLFKEKVTSFKLREFGKFLSIFIYRFSTEHFVINGYLHDKFMSGQKNGNYFYLSDEHKNDSPELADYKRKMGICGLVEIHSQNPLVGENVKRALSRHKYLLNLRKKKV
jgi:hypothetical protein